MTTDKYEIQYNHYDKQRIKTMKTIHTEKSLRAQDGEFENFHYQLEDGEQYQLTKGEEDWLCFISGRYCIYDYINNNTQEDEEGNLILTIDTYEMSEALEDDGISCKAVMLSDDSVLQAIFFYSNHNN